MAYLPDTLKQIVQLGGNLEICDTNYLPNTLEEIVQIARGTGAHITIEARNYLPDTLYRLVQLGGKNVTIKVRTNP